MLETAWESRWLPDLLKTYAHCELYHIDTGIFQPVGDDYPAGARQKMPPGQQGSAVGITGFTSDLRSKVSFGFKWLIKRQLYVP